MSESAATWSKAKDVLTILIIPGLVWVMSVSRSLDAQSIELKALTAQVEENKSNFEKLDAHSRSLSLQLVKLETRLEGITRTTEEIHSLLTQMNNP